MIRNKSILEFDNIKPEVFLTISEQEISAFVDKFLEAIPGALKIKLNAA